MILNAVTSVMTAIVWCTCDVQFSKMCLHTVALFHETERNRAIIVVKCVTKMYHIAI